MSFQCPISSEITGGLFRQAFSVAFMSILPEMNFGLLPKILHHVLIICAITVFKVLTTKAKEARESNNVRSMISTSSLTTKKQTREKKNELFGMLARFGSRFFWID